MWDLPETCQRHRAAWVPGKASGPYYLALYQNYQRLEQCGGKRAGIQGAHFSTQGFPWL